MIALVAAQALAAPDLKPRKPDAAPEPAEAAPEPPRTLDEIARLEWDRGEPMALALLVAGGDTEARVAGVRALGRLRDPDSLQVLQGWVDDPDPAVRVAVAEALGLTPGAESALRPWLARLAPGLRPAPLPTLPLGLLSTSDEGDRELVAVVIALGRVGDERDVSALVDLVSGRWPVGGAAARALATLAGRGVKGVHELATPALVGALSAPDPRTVDDAAWALSRLKPDLSAEIGRIEERLRRGLSVEARAWLVKAAWPSLSREARDELFLRAMTDAPRLVQVAVLQALRPEDVEHEVVAPFLSDADPWVRSATLEALGRSDAEAAAEALLRHAEEAEDPYERADAVLALGRSDPSRAGDPALPPPVRAAWVATLDDRERLVALSTTSEEPVVRTAAAGALSELEAARASDGAALVGATDPVVRAVGVDLLARDPASAPGALLALLGGEEHPEVRVAAWRALAGLLADGKVLAATRKDARLAPLVAAAPERDRGAAGPHVEDIARRAGLPAVVVPRAPERDEVTVAVGSGGAVTVDLRPEDLAEIRRIRSAVVTTDQGRFVVRLAPEVAPLAVSSFAALAEAGWFDGLVVHRVVPGFVVQTGDPRGDGWGGPGYVLPDEDSEVLFDTGALGMAREPDRDTGGSQWFVTTSPQPHLTSEYTWFGEVVQGMAVVDHLSRGAVVEDVLIERLPSPPGAGPGRP